MNTVNVLDTVDVDTAFELIALEELFAIPATETGAPQFRCYGYY